ncbi:MAG: hypothetical protein HYW27_01405 [Candidatus Aenigmarchaeota archaeon]|nr:hypothetical protein [Candidatus Aenigmarchaeota archaeon]
MKIQDSEGIKMKQFLRSKKGISPLIAAVLLIAFTMAIAGIMATWATQFSTQKIEQSSSEAECIGVLDIGSLSFNNGTISVRIKNLGDRLNLTDIKAVVEYSDATKSKQYNIKDFNATDPLAPGGVTFFVAGTGEPAKPQKIQVFSTNCKKNPAELRFP